MSFSPKFILRDAKSKNPTSIKFYFYLDKKRFTYSLGEGKKIHPELWDFEKQRPITVRKRTNKETISKWKKKDPNIETDILNINTRIENVISFTKSFMANKELQQEKLDFSELKSYLNESFGVIAKRSHNDSAGNLEEYLSDFIKGMENGTRLIETGKSEGRQYRPGTIKAYKVLETKLEEYRKHKRKKYIRFSDIDHQFYKDFRTYLYSKNFTPNYFGNFIKNLKCVMNLAFVDNYHNNEDFRSFKKISNESPSIYLTEKELKKLYEYDLSDKPPHLEKYRDIFCAGCYTAQRFSDYSRFKKEWVKKKNGYPVLEFTQRKTGEKVVVPIRHELNEILSKYDYNFPKIHEQKMNLALKDIGEIVGFKDLVEIEKVRGGMEVKTKVPRYKLLTSHVARRTGCTLMFLNGIPDRDIIKISGHKTPAQLRNYIKVTNEETAKRLSMNPFFTGTKLKKV